MDVFNSLDLFAALWVLYLTKTDFKAGLRLVSMIEIECERQRWHHIWLVEGFNPFLERLAWFIKKSKQFNQESYC